uniref:transporter n=1 Tax=Altererythrobacter segetis TaxID=1104773 RepID=UPI001408F63A|nr:transporter [Altererythrobacter segetis]
MYLTRFLCGAAALVFAAPALADHTGPTGVGSSGGGIDVLGPDTLEAGRLALGQQTTVTLPQDRSDAELEALAAQHIHAHNSDYTLGAAVGAAYGVTDRLTISVQVPYIRRDGLREGEHSHSGGVTTNEVFPLGSVSGFGDMSLLAKYSLAGGALALIGGIKMPTGGTHSHALSGERLETEHQPGTGSWDPIAGAALGVPLGWAKLDASVLYQLARTGAQATRLGDRLQAGAALSHRFGPGEHHHDEESKGRHEHQEHHHPSWDLFTSATIEWEGRQTIAGAVEAQSGGTALWLTPGVRYNSAAEIALAAAVGVPLWQDVRPSHPENRVRLIVSLGKAF